MKQQVGHAWMQAATFAAHSHRHQMRKDGRTPYIVHPFRVAMIVRDVFGVADEDVLAAALLHDTIEDTNTDYDDIRRHFGERVAGIVSALTKDMRLPNEAREVAYDRQLAAGPWEARLIKLADVYDNITDAADPASVIRNGEKVARALALAAGDDRLAEAAEKLRLYCASLKTRENPS